MAERFTKSIMVQAAPATVYGLWANFENFPHFMENVKKVTKTAGRTSEWEVAGPLGVTVTWEAETTRLDPNERIAWNTKDNRGLTTSGEVLFRGLSDSQTEVTVTMQYDAPAGKLGELIGNLLADPEGRLEEDLQNFKDYAEGRRSMA